MAALGYDVDFLSVPVPLPAPPGERELRDLPFTHFSVLLDPLRRLAAVTGVNVDGASLRDLERGDDWHLDLRVPPAEQTGPEVYAGNDLDRGHLVRRRDPVWGEPAAAAQANVDSFSYVNAAPQAALFNQGELLWSGLEDYVLHHAQLHDQRLSVFTAPVLAADDPPYRGIRVPRRFWKVVAWSVPAAEAGEPTSLAATGYVLDQTEQLAGLLQGVAGPSRPGEPPSLGAYLTYQVPLSDLADLTGLDLGPLVSADRFSGVAGGAPSGPTAAGPGSSWRRLGGIADVQL